MSGDDFDLLVSRWLAGESSPEDEAQLAERLKTSEEARLRFAELADQEAALRILSQSMVQARQIREEEEASSDLPGSDTTRKIRTLSRRRWRRGAGPGWSAPWTAGIAAAGLFFVMVLFGTVLSPKRAPVARLSEPAPEVEPDPAPAITPDFEAPKRQRQRLQEIEQERLKLEKPEPLPAPDPDAERKRRDALERLDKDRVRLQEAIKRAPEPESPKKEASRTVAATVEGVDGEAFVVSPAGRVAAYVGLRILPGDGLETAGPKSVVRLVFADRTRVELRGDTAVEDVNDFQPAAAGRPAKGKRLRVARGDLAAVVQKQPADQHALFTSPHADSEVLGTTLRIVVGPDATRLDVKEGKVRLTTAQGKSVEVVTGHTVVAAVGIDLVPKPLPIDEILLLPSGGRIHGAEFWRRAKDARTSIGVALEAPHRMSAAEGEARFRKGGLGFVEFAFEADANRDYFLWIRGVCMVDSPDVKERYGWDMVAVVLPDARCVTKDLPFCLNNTAYGYTGWGHRFGGYSWIGGNADPAADRTDSDKVPMTFRFSRPGRQILRMYVYESPLRIDCLWLSTTQTKQPDSSARGPEVLRK